jgi:chromosomal replication initiator protein
MEAGAMQMRVKDRRHLVSTTFGRFVRLPENRSARFACQRLLSTRSSRIRSSVAVMFLHGPTGTGKSHLAQIVIERFSSQKATEDVCFITARDLGKIVAGQLSDEHDLTRNIHRARLLVVEDLQHLPPSSMAAATALLDARQVRLLSTLITAAVGPMALPGFSTRLANRLASGLVVRIRPLTTPSLQKLARLWCREHRLQLTPETVAWIAGRGRSSARSLYGDLTRLQQRTPEHRWPVDFDLARQLLQEDVLPRSSIEAVANAVATWFRLRPTDLRLRDRRPSLLWPRQVAMFAARQQTTHSLAAIGSYFGACDHSTVLHALRKVAHRVAIDPDIAHELAEIISSVS